MKNRYTGRDEEPDERLMRSIEEKIDVAESRKDDFRREIMNYIGALSRSRGRSSATTPTTGCASALELKLFEDQKDTIKFTSIVANVVDRETQEKIDAVKTRMIRKLRLLRGVCAKNVLDFVASIFARGARAAVLRGGADLQAVEPERGEAVGGERRTERPMSPWPCQPAESQYPMAVRRLTQSIVWYPIIPASAPRWKIPQLSDCDRANCSSVAWM